MPAPSTLSSLVLHGTGTGTSTGSCVFEFEDTGLARSVTPARSKPRRRYTASLPVVAPHTLTPRANFDAVDRPATEPAGRNGRGPTWSMENVGRVGHASTCAEAA